VGVILTPIYLLSMLRQVFYGSGVAPKCDINNAGLENQQDEGTVCFGTDCLLPTEAVYIDAKPRELLIAACFLLPIVGIGFYPKLAEQIYDVKTVAVNAQVRQSYSQIAQTNPQIYANRFLAPRIKEPEVAPVLGIVK
jgi:NAD(P)H-quinone oxidoreductase subunit 4